MGYKFIVGSLLTEEDEIDRHERYERTFGLLGNDKLNGLSDA